MTGQKDRYTTTEKLWKLDDQTLSTPKHDEMVLWLLNKDNVLNILPKPSKIYIEPISVDCFKKGQTSISAPNLQADLINYKTLPEGYNWLLSNDDWKLIKLEYDSIAHLLLPATKLIGEIGIIKSEVPITAKNGFLVGYTDIEINWIDGLEHLEYIQLSNYHPFPKTYIEVKPVIKSFGETLRQLNTYKHYLHTEQLYLFTTDLRFKEAFESQGITVLTYPDK